MQRIDDLRILKEGKVGLYNPIPTIQQNFQIKIINKNVTFC